MGKSHIPFKVNLLSTALHFLWAYLFVILFGLGVAGAGVAFTITQLISLISLYIVMSF
jgi:Na+-driven multidrug efflux pump